MSRYVDGFVIPVPREKLDEYRAIAEVAALVWREHGALEYHESIGDDLHQDQGIPFPTLVNAGPDETVAFSWIVYESREKRDEVNAKVFEDPRMKRASDSAEKLFDCTRVSWGGFRELVLA